MEGLQHVLYPWSAILVMLSLHKHLMFFILIYLLGSFLPFLPQKMEKKEQSLVKVCNIECRFGLSQEVGVRELPCERLNLSATDNENLCSYWTSSERTSLFHYVSKGFLPTEQP